MISENDVKYLEKICEETGAPVDKILKYDTATACAEFAARHWDDPATMKKWDSFYARIKLEDAEAMFEVNGLFDSAKEKKIKFLDVAADNPGKSYMEIADKVLGLLYTGSPINAQGRISVNNMKYVYEIKICLSEGHIDTYHILTCMENIARGKESGPQAFGNNIHMLMLALDDMGMRGIQIIYARDYYDGNMQALYDGIRSRDGRMIEYINKRTAMEYNKDRIHNPDYIAVGYGASSTHHGFGAPEQEFHLDPFNMHRYMKSDVEPIKIDYKKMDIREGVDRETGIRIAQAYGFEMMFEHPFKTDFDERVQIVMVNKKTGDMLSADTTKDNMVYGGCRILAPRYEGVKRAIFKGEPGVHGNCEEFEGTPWRLWECSYHEGCFAQYRTIPVISADEIPWDKAPYRGGVDMPLPELVNENLCWSFFSKLPDDLEFLYPYVHSEAYTVPMFANLMAAPGMIRKFVPEDCHKYYCRILDDPAQCFADSSYLSIYSPVQFVILFRLSAAITGISPEDIVPYKEAIVNEALDNLAKITENFRLRHSTKTDVDDAKNFVNVLKKLDFIPDALDRYIVSKFYDRVKEPSPDELPQDAVTWIREKAPDRYKHKNDWYLYGCMRDEYQMKRKKT